MTTLARGLGPKSICLPNPALAHPLPLLIPTKLLGIVLSNRLIPKNFLKKTPVFKK